MASSLFSLRPEKPVDRQLIDPKVLSYTLEDEYTLRQDESSLQDALHTLESLSHQMDVGWTTISNMTTANEQVTSGVTLESAALNLNILSYGLLNSTESLAGYSMESVQEFSSESIASVARKIVTSILKWLKDIVTWIINFVKNIFSALTRLSRKVAQVQRSAVSIKSDTKPTSPSILPRHVSNLHIENVYDGYPTLHTGIIRVSKMLDTVLETFQDDIVLFYTEFNDALTDSSNGLSHMENVDTETKKDILRSILDRTAEVKDKLLNLVRDDCREDPINQFKHMPGGYSLIENENTIVVHNQSAHRNVDQTSTGTDLNYRVYRLVRPKDYVGKDEYVPTLTKDECLTLLSEISDVIAGMQAAEKMREELSKRVDGVRKALSVFVDNIKSAFSRNDTIDTQADQFVDLTVRQYTQLATQRMELSLIQMDHYCFRVIKGVLDNVIQSIKLYDTSSKVSDDDTQINLKDAPALR